MNKHELEFLAISKVIIYAWENNIRKITNVFVETVKKEVLNEARKNPNFKKIVKSWGVGEGNLTGTDKNRFDTHMNEFAYLIILANYEQMKECVQNNSFDQLLKIKILINNEIQAQKKVLDRERHVQINDKVDAKTQEELLEEYSEKNKAKDISIFYGSPKENNRLKGVLESFKNIAQPLKKYCSRNTKLLAKKFLKEIAEEVTNGKTIYQIHKDYKLPFMRLLTTFKSINFPMMKDGGNNSVGNIILKKDLALFHSIHRQIKSMWTFKDIHKSWIDEFKRKGWNKSRISHYMERLDKRGTVPLSFFCIIPPNDKLLLEIIKSPERTYRRVLKKISDHKVFLYYLKNNIHHKKIRLDLLNKCSRWEENSILKFK